ncbi:MAG: HK97 gp10 family phage protein [Rhodocyclaceae bacterium]|nr:HK97 gp10 family phage protein [Rhodocyclaceae bacterium]MCP5234796.1 HK97 gp10 family phage protein [Zoogloeaceae bacterium]
MNETRLTGLDDVLKRLEQVAEKVAKKALSKATRKGGNVIRKAAIANAPVDSGDLRKHIALRLKVKPGAIYCRVGVKGGAKKKDGTPYYWRFVEFGTVRQPAQPFMRPALDNTATTVLQTVVGTLRDEVARL